MRVNKTQTHKICRCDRNEWMGKIYSTAGCWRRFFFCINFLRQFPSSQKYPDGVRRTKKKPFHYGTDNKSPSLYCDLYAIESRKNAIFRTRRDEIEGVNNMKLYGFFPSPFFLLKSTACEIMTLVSRGASLF